MEKLSQYVFGIPYNVKLVPEVQWISEILNNKNNQIKNSRIDFQSTFSIKWTKGKVDNVKGNVTLIDSLQGRRFSNSLNNDLFESKKYSRYFVSYYANNQGKITCDPEIPQRTKHPATAAATARYAADRAGGR